jgi:hypothetical protein
MKTMEKTINAHKILVGNSKGRRPLTRQKFCLNDNIKIQLKEKGWDEMNWYHLAQHVF